MMPDTCCGKDDSLCFVPPRIDDIPKGPKRLNPSSSPGASRMTADIENTHGISSLLSKNTVV